MKFTLWKRLDIDINKWHKLLDSVTEGGNLRNRMSTWGHFYSTNQFWGDVDSVLEDLEPMMA